MKDKNIRNWGTFILLILLLVSRMFLDDESSKWIQLISLMGVIISFFDLYGQAYRENYQKDKFQVIRGIALICMIIMMLIAAGMISNCIVFSSKGNDVLTILALLLTLPSDLYCSWITKYVNN